jgi:hypothetical protein
LRLREMGENSCSDKPHRNVESRIHAYTSYTNYIS